MKLNKIEIDSNLAADLDAMRKLFPVPDFKIIRDKVMTEREMRISYTMKKKIQKPKEVEVNQKYYINGTSEYIIKVIKIIDEKEVLTEVIETFLDPTLERPVGYRMIYPRFILLENKYIEFLGYVKKECKICKSQKK